MKRVSVVGNSGSGKTTLARSLAIALGASHLELDSIFHRPGWSELDPGEFRRQVGEVVAGEAWVVDGNYSVVRDLVWRRADTVVWLDPPQRRVMAQVVGRTVRRVLTRQELWNGNREPWSNLWSWDPNRSIIAWAWTQRQAYRTRYAAAGADPAWGHLDFRRLRSRADCTRLLQAAAGDGPEADK
jgi:adenylate kinase family enzyme